MRPFVLNDLLYIVLAVRWTVLLSLAAFAGGALFGIGIALMRVSEIRVVRWLAAAYIRVVQGTPLLIQLVLVFFGSSMLGLPLPPFVAAALGLSVNAGAFLGEIWRAAIQAVPRGQTEAARALGLHYGPRMLRVVAPQALRVATAPTVGFLVNLVKGTSLAAVVSFVDLTRAGQLVNNATFSPFTVFGTVALIYFLLCWPLTLASRRLEARLASAYQR